MHMELRVTHNSNLTHQIVHLQAQYLTRHKYHNTRQIPDTTSVGIRVDPLVVPYLLPGRGSKSMIIRNLLNIVFAN
jgi:hypothetical protein